MATIAHQSPPTARLSGVVTDVMSFFGDITRAGHAASRYQHLASLNERQLEALGCTREEAARAAYEESFGKL